MSCRSTKGGTVAHRLARANSGLTDTTVQTLFHALKREGAQVPAPTKAQQETWREKTRQQLNESYLTDVQRERSEHDLFIAKDETPDGPTFYSWSSIEARARQESVIREMKGQVIDLESPGSQAHNYTYDADGRPTTVWYASYGSNLDRKRFMTYIEGGTPEGSHTHHFGARDTTPPTEDAPIRYKGRMHFAARSGRWGGGGVAFIDNDSSGHALGRAYKLGIQQFDDVVSQENGLTAGDITVDTKKALADGTSEATPGLYGTLVHIGDYRNAPVFTFTGKFSAADALGSSTNPKLHGTATNTPSKNYIRMIGNGLSETFGMQITDQADYIRGSLGAHNLTRENLITTLSTPADITPAPKKYVTSTETRYVSRGYTPTIHDNETRRSRSNRPDKLWDGLKDAGWVDGAEYWGPAETDNAYEPLVDNDWPAPTEADRQKAWWRNDHTKPVKTPTAKPVYQFKICDFCGEPGHKMQDCSRLPSNQ